MAQWLKDTQLKQHNHLTTHLTFKNLHFSTSIFISPLMELMKLQVQIFKMSIGVLPKYRI